MPDKLSKCLDELKSGKKLTHVDLSNCNLTEFPNELFECKDIIELINMGGNSLSSLPDQFKEFKQLKILFFANNLFETIPEVLGELPNLYMISFKSNRLSFISEKSLSSSVGWLILTDNQLTELPMNLGWKCPLLRKVMLASNQLSFLPDSMENCKKIELIRLAGNRFDRFPQWLFTSLPKLAWCALAGNPVFDEMSESSTIDSNPSSTLIDWSTLSIEEKLGEGASGIVYRAKWKESSSVAVKLFKGQATSDGFPEDEMKVS